MNVSYIYPEHPDLVRYIEQRARRPDRTPESCLSDKRLENDMASFEPWEHFLQELSFTTVDREGLDWRKCMHQCIPGNFEFGVMFPVSQFQCFDRLAVLQR